LDKDVILQILDTSGEENYDEIRKIVYERTDIFFILYSPFVIGTIEKVDFWMNELKNQVPNSIIYLISNSLEKPKNKKVQFSTLEGKDLQKKIEANEFFECKKF
jgi:GTPase SAR1 family protein